MRIVSITSRCGGGLDCIPAGPHGYAANKDFDFLKNLKIGKSATLYGIILSLFFVFVKKNFVRKKLKSHSLSGYI